MGVCRHQLCSMARVFCRVPSLSCMGVCVCVHVLSVISLTVSLSVYTSGSVH